MTHLQPIAEDLPLEFDEQVLWDTWVAGSIADLLEGERPDTEIETLVKNYIENALPYESDKDLGEIVDSLTRTIENSPAYQKWIGLEE